PGARRVRELDAAPRLARRGIAHSVDRLIEVRADDEAGRVEIVAIFAVAVIAAPAPVSPDRAVERERPLRRDALEIDAREREIGIEPAHHEAGFAGREQIRAHRVRQEGIVSRNEDVSAVVVAEPDIIVPHPRPAQLGGDLYAVAG